MKIEDQVCTLEQAKRLKELGIEQKGIFSWIEGKIKNIVSISKTELSAFTVAELGVMLPDGTQVKGLKISQFRSFRIAWISVGKYGIKDGYVCSADYSSPRGVSNGVEAYEVWYSTEGKTEAEARAAMLIYLLENNLITAEEVNKKLIL